MATKKELDLLKTYCKGWGLNIGCGPRSIPGAINVDIGLKADADVYAPAQMLPFYSNRFDYIVSSHCLEHVQEAPLLILREWHRVLKVGGRLAFIVPDGNYGSHALGETPGIFIEDKHVHIFTGKILEHLMTYTGFVDVAIKHIRRVEWKSDTILVTGIKFNPNPREIPGNSLHAYLLWLGAVRKTVTLQGLSKWMTKRW